MKKEGKRHTIDYLSAIRYYGLTELFHNYLDRQLTINRRRRRPITSMSRFAANFCKLHKLVLYNSVFDKTEWPDEVYGV